MKMEIKVLCLKADFKFMIRIAQAKIVMILQLKMTNIGNMF